MLCTLLACCLISEYDYIYNKLLCHSNNSLILNYQQYGVYEIT